MAPNHDIATRALVVTLKSVAGKSNSEVCYLTGLPESTVRSIYAKAIKRGFEYNASQPITICNAHLEDAPRSGRPTKETEAVRQSITQKLVRDRYGREKSCADLAGELSQEGVNISATTVRQILKKAGYKKTKPTRKPGLTKKMREERLAWCKEREKWTLEDWKNVIWTDETSVVLNHRRGGYRIWRKSDEAFLRSTIRERWKGYSEFMFWGSFSYDKKGPCHCWQPESRKQKEEARKAIEALNQELEAEARAEWELNTGVRRLGLRTKPGKKLTWKFTADTGKLTRGKGNGIDWWRYRAEILIPKLLPFAQECKKERLYTLVQEDKAPSHAHHSQQKVFNIFEVARLLWCGNSPDLNAIECCWPYMKRLTTKKGAPRSKVEAIRAWTKAWDELPQWKIQEWIERIPIHIQNIIRLEGGNEYKEGRRTGKGTEREATAVKAIKINVDNEWEDISK